ncbi:MAG TPA: PIN domain-containing protein [Chloroflexota bacterium]
MLRSGIHVAIVDTGPLYAVADRTDDDHQRSLAVCERPDLRLVIPALVVAETSYLLGTRAGPVAEAAFLRGLRDFEIVAPAADDWLRIAELVEQYADFPLGGTDASVVTLAERLDTDLIITLDRRHFAAIRPRHCAALQILPE